MKPVKGVPSWSRVLHRAVDGLTPSLQPALARSEMARRAWTAVLDAVVAVQSDRRYLKTLILPALAGQRLHKVLFVGVRAYTRSYEKWFVAAGAEFWTTDIDPAAARYGAKDRHRTGDISKADQLFPEGRFDLVILNGIFGWGVDDPRHMDATLVALHAILEKDGLLLVGWNHDRSPDPDTLPAIQTLFSAASVGGLPARQGFKDVTHVYSWYRRREPPG